MSQTYQILNGTQSNDPIINEDGGILQLSDGTLVHLYETLANNTLYLEYSVDRVNRITIDNPDTWFTSTFDTLGGYGNTELLKIIRDSSDNIYVIGVSTTYIGVQAFAKGVGHLWTKKTRLVSPSQAFTPQGVAAVWCGTGGGTAGKGHIMVVFTTYDDKLGYAIIDAGAALAGAGTLVTQIALNPTFLGGATASNTLGGLIDIEGNTFGGTSGLAVGAFATPGSGYSANMTLKVGRWSVTSAGLISTNALISTETFGPPYDGGKIRLIRYNTNEHALIGPSTSLRFFCVQFSDTARITPATDSGVIFSPSVAYPDDNEEQDRCWGAFADPASIGTIWIPTIGPVTSGKIPIVRAAVDLAPIAGGGGITWRQHGVTEGNGWIDPGKAHPSPEDGPHLRCPKHAYGVPTIMDWQAYVEVATSGSQRWALVGGFSTFETAPLAPALLAPIANVVVDRTLVQRFSWTFSDPDAGDTQGGFDLEWRVVGATSWTDIPHQDTATAYYDMPDSILPIGNLEWRARVYDSHGAVGPWSASAFFSAGAAPAPPVITDPAAESTVATNPRSVTWTIAAQQSYQILRTDEAKTNVYWDSGEVVSVAARTASIPFDVSGRWEYVRIRCKVAGWWSAWADVHVHVVYTQVAAPTAIITTYPLAAHAEIVITNPVGSPLCLYNLISRRIAGDPAWEIVAVVDPGATYDDYSLGGKVPYEYVITSVGENTTSHDSITYTTLLPMTGTWIHDPDDPPNTIYRFKWDGMGRSIEETADMSLMDYAGREFPAVEFGTKTKAKITMTLPLEAADEVAMRALVARRSTLLYRDGRGRKYYIAINSLPLEDKSWGEMLKLEATAVDYGEGMII